MAIRQPSWVKPSRRFATLFALIVVLAASACASSSAGAGSASAGGGSAEMPYRGPSWASYLDMHPGRSCMLKGAIAMGQAGSVNSTLTQTVLSSSGSVSGTVIRYRIQTSAVASGGGLPPTGTSQTVPYEILPMGRLAWPPATTHQSKACR